MKELLPTKLATAPSELVSSAHCSWRALSYLSISFYIKLNNKKLLQVRRGSWLCRKSEAGLVSLRFRCRCNASSQA